MSPKTPAARWWRTHRLRVSNVGEPFMDHNGTSGGIWAPIRAHSSWVADPVSLPHIRAHTRHWLAPLALDEGTEQDLVLAVNEAASNAIEHAYTAPDSGDLVVLSFWTDPRHLYVEV